MYKKINISLTFINKMCKKFLLHYVSFYLIFSPIFSSKILAQSLPINPVSGGDMGASSNNVPVLNIAKPSDAGVSVNKFTDFNVGQEGLIINNLNLQNYNFNYKSELSGEHIEFNRNFRDGDAAKIILNEVVSGNPTSLLGTTEIYGVKADYIVANPNGITCAGCGFINTSRLSLITGSSNIKNGDIESFTISPNAVLRIEGNSVGNLGLYSPSSADLVSNVIKISGEIQTPEDLRIFQGDKSFDWKNFSITSSENIGSDIALDVSSLGGMKANNIYVVATGKGFGVNLGSDVVANGNIVITSAGEIKVKNTIANDNVIMQTSKKITAENGNIVANNVLIDADNLENKSNIVASDDIYINTKNDIKNIGKIRADNLFLSAKDIHNYGQILSNKDMEILTSNNLINYRASGILAGGNIFLKIANNLINYKADIYAGGDLIVEGREDIENNFTDINPDTVYDNPYIEKEVIDSVNVDNKQITFDDESEEDESAVIILSNGEKIKLPDDAFSGDNVKSGDSYEYMGYTFIVGEEVVGEEEVPNPEYATCENDCEGIPQTIKKKTYKYIGDEVLTIKDSDGNNISYTYEEIESEGDIDEELGALNNTSVIQSDTLNGYQNNFLDYDFNDNFLNNFVNLAGRIEAKGNIEINANNIVNKSFDINTGENGVNLSYDKKRSSACSWICGWRELGRYKIESVNLDGVAGIIKSGADLILNANKILNQSSIISSDENIILKAKDISNITTSDVVALAILMQRKKISTKHGKIKKKTYNRTDYEKKRYYSKQRSTILAGKNLSIKSDTLKNDQDLNPTSGIVATIDNPNIVDGKISVDINLPVGDNGLFKVSDSGKYLVETNVPFIDATDYVGSDYFFKGKGSLFNGVDTNKIIGDPAYETKLVMDAIVKATGEHYLENDGSIGSDTDQMKALYDNATEIYEEFGLKVGVALTEEQIAALHKDIIWYVEKEVNGEKVLVPELYLSQATLDEIDDNKGSKISGFNVGIESDFVSNYGDIKSSDLLDINAKTLLNSGNDENAAKITSGGNTKINADNVLNLSGTISGKTVQVEADNIISQTKVLSDDYEGPNVKRHTEITGATSTISGENGVSLNAKNTLVNSGADIESSNGDVIISANTAVFDTVELFNREEKHTSSSNGISSKEKVEINETRKNQSSNINAGGNLILSTNGDTTFAGANVSVGGDALLDIGGQTNILDVKDTEFNYSKTTKSYAGGLYSKKDTVIDESEKAKGTSVDVTNGLNIISGGDVNIVASDVNVGGDANILAGYSLTDEGVKKTDASSSVNILNDLETTRHYEKHETTNMLNAVVSLAEMGLALTTPYFPNSQFVNKDGKIGVEVELGEKSSHEEETISKNVVSSNLNVGGNLQIGATDNITIAASNLIGGDILLDSKLINVVSAITSSTEKISDEKTSISASVKAGNSYVDLVIAEKSYEEALKAKKEAKKALEDIRELYEQGKATSSAVDDAETNLKMAEFNLGNAAIGLTSAIAGAAGSSLIGGIYLEAGLSMNTTKTTENTSQETNVASNIVANNDISFNADNMNQVGSNVMSTDGNIVYNIKNDLNLEASLDKYDYSSKTNNTNLSVGVNSKNGVSGDVGISNSSQKSSDRIYNNSTSIAENGSIVYKVGGDMNAVGYNAIAENIVADVGGDLNLTSLQNSSHSSNKSNSFNAGYSSAGANGGVSNSRGKEDRDWVDNQTSLIGTKSVDIDVDGKLSMTGSLIANIDENGVDTGNLNIKAGSLEYSDIDNKEESEQKGFSFSQSGINENMFSHPKGSTTIGMTDKSSEKESITHATIGNGNIEIADGSGEGINRDINNAEEMIKDLITGALDGSITIDNRWFDGEGRSEILNNMVNVFGNIIAVGVNVAEGIYNIIMHPVESIQDIVDQVKNSLKSMGDSMKKVFDTIKEMVQGKDEIDSAPKEEEKTTEEEVNTEEENIEEGEEGEAEVEGEEEADTETETDEEDNSEKEKEAVSDDETKKNKIITSNGIDKCLTDDCVALVNNETLLKGIIENEEPRENAYLDSNGYLSIGIGMNVSSLENFLELDLMYDGRKLTEEEKEYVYKELIKQKNVNKSKPINITLPNGMNTLDIKLENFDDDTRVRQHLVSSYTELKKRFKDFDTYPDNLKIVMLDMQYNMGTPNFSIEKWPHFHEALGIKIDEKGKLIYTGTPINYVELAKQCKNLEEDMKTEINPKRNTWRSNLLTDIK